MLDTADPQRSVMATTNMTAAVAEGFRGIRELERACAEHSSSLHMVGVAPEFAALRSDERFLAILRKIGLDPARSFAASAVPLKKS